MPTTKFKVHLTYINCHGKPEALCGAHNQQRTHDIQLSPYTKLVDCKRCLNKNEKRLKASSEKGSKR